MRKATSSGTTPILEDSVEYVYDPYGKLLEVKQPYNDSIGLYNPLIYKDYIYDFDTELYYLQSRYYDPEVGRFLNGDGYCTTGQGITDTNMFAYCGNNPINYVDPTGEIPFISFFQKPLTMFFNKLFSALIATFDRKPVNKISDNGIKFIAEYEQFFASPYDDGYGNMTIGYGHLIEEGESFSTISKTEALNLLKSDLTEWEDAVNSYSDTLEIKWDQNEFDAYVSLAYNSGYNFQGVMKKIKQGSNPYDAFSSIIYSSGKKSLGLYRRRMDEADMFVNGTYTRTYRNW